jgi:hypothetical protein
MAFCDSRCVLTPHHSREGRRHPLRATRERADLGEETPCLDLSEAQRLAAADPAARLAREHACPGES